MVADTVAHHSGAILDDESLRIWGYPSYGAKGDGVDSGYRAVAPVLNKQVIFATFGWHNCMVTTIDGEVYTWG